jgi:heme-degrading monooxygenase HmoA
MAERPLVAVTEHAAERFRQRVGSRRGLLDVRPELATRVADAVARGRIGDEPPPGATGARGTLYVRDGRDPHVIYVCRREGSELVVVTLWEDETAPGGARVPRRFTDALKATDGAVRDWAQRDRDRDR